MQKITLTIKEDKKVNFLIELLNQFDFIEIQKSSREQGDNYDFFASKGMWKGRNINANNSEVRHWQRNNPC